MSGDASNNSEFVHKKEFIVGKIEIGTNRNEVFMSPDGAYVYKPETHRELENYKIINRYRDKLSEKGVYFPELLSPETMPGYLAMLSFPGFSPYNIEEHFGKFETFDDKQAIQAYLTSLRTIAEIIPTSEFKSRPDDEESIFETLKMIATFKPLIEKDTEKFAPYENFYKVVEDTQLILEKLDSVAHKDANPSNWRVVKTGDKVSINFVDLETLGIARPGWDEGRSFVLFSLSSDKQNLMLSLMKEESVFKEEKTMTYFWRVVVLRSLRELYLLRNGKYDKPLELYQADTAKRGLLAETIADSVLRTLSTGIKKLQ